MPRDTRELGGAWTRSQHHEFDEPVPDLAPFVAHVWSVTWDYPEPYRQKIVPYPQVHLTVRPSAGPPEVHGVADRHVVRELTGTGRVVGAAFRPGVFRAFLPGQVRAITGRVVPARDLPCFAGAPADPVDAQSLQDWLRAVLPCSQPSAAACEASALVERVAGDRSLTRVDELAAVAGTGVRGLVGAHLTRDFTAMFGEPPGWYARRYRAT